MLKDGIFEESARPWSRPTVVVLKPDEIMAKGYRQATNSDHTSAEGLHGSR